MSRQGRPHNAREMLECKMVERCLQCKSLEYMESANLHLMRRQNNQHQLLDKRSVRMLAGSVLEYKESDMKIQDQELSCLGRHPSSRQLWMILGTGCKSRRGKEWGKLPR